MLGIEDSPSGALGKTLKHGAIVAEKLDAKSGEDNATADPQSLLCRWSVPSIQSKCGRQAVYIGQPFGAQFTNRPTYRMVGHSVRTALTATRSVPYAES